MLPRVHKYDEFVRPLTWLHEAGFKSAIIAGGAFRDLYHNLYPRDIDIFCWDPAYSNEVTPFTEFKDDLTPVRGNPHVWRVGTQLDAAWANLFQLGDFDRVEQLFGDYGGDEEAGKITAVWDINKGLHQTNFQVIFTKLPPLEHMDQNFNIGLCKCYCDGRKIRYTNDFITDATNKTLTIVAKNMTPQEYSYTMNDHIPRLRTRYPYAVKHSPENEHFINQAEITRF